TSTRTSTSMQEDDLEVQEVVEVVTTTKLITKVVTTVVSQVSAASATIPAAKPSIPAAAPTVDAAMDHVNQKSNNPQYIKRYQGMKKRPHTESEARKNMMIYLKNTAGYKMDFFKGMTKWRKKIRRLSNKRINETPVQKAAKRRKLSEEAQEAKDLRKCLEVVDDEDDDVFIEATPLAKKVPVVDYQIVLIDNKPRFKIIKADETHQYPLSKFTLKQLVNVTRLQVEEEKIFAGLARIGYEKPSTKLTFYKAFFSTQWKLFIHTILHSLSVKRTSWNEFSSAMASALICLSSGQRFNFSKVGKGFSGVETPLFENMLAVRDVADEEEEAQVPAQGDDVQEPTAEEVATDVVPPTPTSPSPSSPRVLDTCSALALRVEGLENDKAAQQLEIVKLKARVKKLEKINKVKSSNLRRLKKVGTSQRIESSDDVDNVFNHGRMIVDMDQDEGIELVTAQEKDAKVEGRHTDKQAQIYNIDLDHSSKVLSMQEDDTEVQEAVEVVTTAKLMNEVVTAATTQIVAASTPIPAAKPKTLTITVAPAVSTRKRKGVVIRDPKEDLPSDTLAETLKVKDKGKGILIEASRPMKKKDQIEIDAEYARKLQEEINKEHEEAYKNIDWNVALDHV
nr:hypothetical protein [Tanacetum cinerariifolium]